MKSFMAIIGILAAFIGGCYAFWSSVFQNIHVRYRLTVEVRVNDEVKIGTSVIDVLYTITPDSFQSLGGAGGSLPQFDGYAPTVDLGKKGLLFLTFANGFGAPRQQLGRGISCSMGELQCLPFAGYGKDNEIIGPTYSSQKEALIRLLRQHGPRDLPFSSLPELVTFTQIDNPYSIERVIPTDLSAKFGPGVSLSRATIELTDEPVTPTPTIWPTWLKAKHPAVYILVRGRNG